MTQNQEGHWCEVLGLSAVCSWRDQHLFLWGRGVTFLLLHMRLFKGGCHVCVQAKGGEKGTELGVCPGRHFAALFYHEKLWLFPSV